MAAPRRVVELAFARDDVAELTRLARSRTEPVSRAERARMLLAYRETPSFYAVGRALGVTHQTVERCVRRAEKFGVMEALDDSPRPGRERIITEEARTFVVDLACRKPKDLGYPHELWTTRLLTRHIREHGPAVGHKCLANLAQGTLCKILAAYEIRPHKVRYGIDTLTNQWASAGDNGSGHEAHFLCPPPISARCHPARCLALPPVHLELPGCRGSPG